MRNLARQQIQTVKKLLLGSLSLTVMSCTSTQISLHTSPPEAEVWAKPVGGGARELVGKTPLYLKTNEITKKHPNKGAFEFELRREGYNTETIYITEVLNVDVQITKELIPKTNWDLSDKINHSIDVLFEARRLIDVKRYDEALAVLNQLKVEFPRMSAIHEMEGGIHLLQAQYMRALDSYTRAYESDRKNAALIRPIQELRRHLNLPKLTDVDDLLRLPSSVTGTLEENKE